MRDCNSQLSPRADNSLISANRSSQSSSCVQVRKARRPSCSMTRSSSSAKPSSSRALSSARREATSSTVTCSRRPGSAASFSSAKGPLLAASAPEPARVSAELALAPPAYANIAVDPDVHQQAKPQHHRNHSRSAIGNQRQRHPDDRNEAHDHRGVDESIEKEIGRDPKTKQPSEEAAAAQGDGKGIADQDDIKPEQDQAADEAEFLGDHREDEIGLLLGQEAQMGL